MGAPEIIMICIYVFNITYSFMKHGQNRCDETHNGFLGIFGTLVSIALLYWGGFWG